MTLPLFIRNGSTIGRIVVAVALAATALLAVPGSVREASAQTGVCPVGTTLGTTSWGTGGMVWDNNAAHQVSGASETYNNVAGQVDLTLSYTDPANVNEDLDNPYLDFVTGDSWDGPVYTQTNGTYGAAYFTIVMNSLSSDQDLDWNFAFNKPVFVPDFTVSDVDWAGYGYNNSGIGTPHESFQDEVVLAGQRGGNAIATTATGGSGIQDLGGGRLTAGPYVAGVNGNVGPADAAGTVSLTTVGPVTSFNMTYSNGPDDAVADALDGSPPAPIPANSPGVSNNHAVAISNFTVCAGNLRFGDLVWSDIDGDGVRDPGEPGIGGVVVSIADPDGNVVETQTTAADGSYEFEQFPGFTWVVSIAAPAGYTSTYDRDGGDLSSTAINPTANEFDIDFGLQPDPGTITGSVFTDLNNNGLFNPAQQEVALPGVTIDLTGQDLAGNTVTGTTTTAADGSYTFTDVPAGVYQVAETQPTAGFADGNDTPGTNAAADGNDQHEVTLGQLESSAGNNFAEVPTSSISGNVYEDDNDSASLDSGEAGIGSVPITVAGTDVFGNAVTFDTTTAADGTYTVDQLISGTYSVTETAQPSAYADGQESVGSNGGTIAPEAVTTIALGFDEDATDYDFGELPTSSIAGNVTDEAADPIGGVTITLTGTDDLGGSVLETTTTAADGSYSFIDLRPGTYTVTETQPAAYGDGSDSVGTIAGTSVGTLGNDVLSNIAINVGDNGIDYDFTETLGSIAGSVVDDDGNPIAGVTIDLVGTDANGQSVTASTTTATDGTYEFDDLVGGTYTVTETQPAGYGDGGETAGTAGGDDSVNDVISAISLGGGVDATGYDFDETRSSLSGQVFVDPDNDGLFTGADTAAAGVTITLTGTDVLGGAVSATTTTATDGSYTFDGLIAGTYQIDETQPAAYVDGIDTLGSEGGTDTVNDRFSAISLGAGIDGTGYDFAELPPAGVTGSVTDSNGDPISGVTLTLTGTSSFGTSVSETTTTALDGSYSFFDLPPGTYTVTETQPAGYGDGPDSVGAVGGTSVGTLGNDVLSNIVLDTDSIGVDYDFTETYASIAGTVVDDDGTGIAGVAIALSGTDDLGASVSLTTTTAADGTYSFDELLGGTYTVAETQPIAYGDGGETAGTSGGDSTINDQISAIALSPGVDATGYDFDETRGSLRGRVYEDTNNNGASNSGEPRLAGVTITLTGTDVLGNAVSLSTTTNTSGNYRFDDLFAGTYTINETQPAGYADGIDTAGSPGGDLSVNDEISDIPLSAGQIANGYYFGEILPSSISGTVFVDDNDNGSQNSGEAGIAGVDVDLTGTDDLGATVTASTTTATDGTYSFDDLRPGTYTVTETQPGAFLDGTDSAGSAGGTVANDVISAITLPTNSDATGYDFGELEGASISGTVVDDGGNPIESVTITLTGTDDLGGSVSATTTTANDGTYSFTGLRPGTYTVTESQPAAYGDGGQDAGTVAGASVGDDTTVNDQISGIVLPAASDAIDYDFDETRGSIAGVVFEDTNNNGTQDGGEAGITGASVRLTGVDASGTPIDILTTTIAGGSYVFEPLLAGTYTVTETQPAGYLDGIDTAGTSGGSVAVNDVISSITLAGGADSTANNFGELLASDISGTVVDDDNTGIAGVTIALTGTDDLGATVTATTTTASGAPGTAGTYSFTGLRPGTYTITETQPAGYLDAGETAGSEGGAVADDVISAITLPSDTSATGYDFDEVRASSIAGTVVDDASDGIAGVTIDLSGTDDLGASVTATTTTATDGTYSFDGLRPGSYTVTETQPAAYGDGGETAGTVAGVTVGDDTANDVISAITLPANTDATGYDFDETRGSITGLVFEDTNNNGTQDSGEPAISGTLLQLSGTDVLGGTVLVTGTTQANGTVVFDDLLAGTYDLDEIQPAGYLDGIDTVGTSGGTVGPDEITAIALTGGTNATDYTFGELLASSVAGSVFDDDNGNGTQQASEAGIGGVTVDLSGTDDLGATLTATTTTATDGTYSFTGLRPGTYTVTETQPAAFFDGIDTAGTSGGNDSVNDVISAIALPSDTDATGYDFAEIEAASIAGTVVDDAGTGIAGVTITLTGTDDLGATVTATTTTAAGAPGTAGTYSFTGLRPGTYTVTETQPAAYGDGGETAGTAGGNDSVDDVISAIALGAEEDATGYDFDETRHSIAGTVYEDTNGSGAQNGTEPGIAGITVELTGTDVLGNAVALSTTTAGNGSYSFDDLLNGTYTVAETQPTGYADAQETIGSAGGTNSVNDEIALTLAGADATGYDFGEVQDASIAGTVVDDGGTGIAGVAIALSGTDDLGASVTASTATATNGTYGFNGLRPGTYTVTETQPAGYGDGGETAGTAGGDDSVDDVISTINLASDEDATGYDFDETRGSIAGTVYEDTNNNGTQDSGEPAISSVTVELDGTDVFGNAVNLTATTIVDGSYSFDNLLTGVYTVTETQPAGFLDGVDSAGTAGGTVGADEVTAIALAGGDDATGYDFGELLASSINGTVVDDLGTGIGGVTVTLTGTDDLGATVTATTTTLADGSYSFTSLRPGTYTVTETQPAAYLDGGETAGTAGGDDSVDDVISAITLPSDTDATGYDFDELLASSISGTVVDDGTNGIAGVTITLTGTDDLGATVTATTTTATGAPGTVGTYSFTGLRPGTYTVTETQPAGYGDGDEDAGSEGGDDSVDDVISAIALPVRTDATGYDFDETRSSIAGTVYEDLNGNAVQNGTEPGISGVTIELTGTDVLGNAVSLSTTTASGGPGTAGSYSFVDLIAGTYTVAETQPTGYADGQETIGSAGGTNATNDEIAVTLAGGIDATSYDFGEVQAASIAGTVVDDAGTGIAGVTITLTGTDDLGATVTATTTTASGGPGTAGTYSFDSLRPGTYTVTETQPGAYGDGGEDAGTAGGNDTVNDVISAITLASGEDATGYDFDETRGSVAGVVFDDTNNNGTQDSGEPAISGVTVELDGVDANGDAVSLSTTTAGDGSYSFDDLLAGTYDVSETQPTGYLDGIDTAGTSGGTVGADEVTAIALTGGVNATGYDFGEIQPSSIAGTVVDDASTGIAGVTITLTGTDDLGATVTASTTTATDGTYSFDDLRPGTYTVTETQPTAYLDGGETAGSEGGTVTDDAVSAFTLGTGTNATGYDFDEILASSIAGSVVDDGGNGIDNVTVDLTGTDDLGATVTATTTTLADGSYSFTSLRPGTYTVTETQPAGYGDGGETPGTAGGDDTTNDVISAITLPVRTDATGYDFDETRGSIAGTVYEDLNGNGTQNGTEPGIAGVTVELTGTDLLGNAVSLSTTTASGGPGTAGSYSFDDLIAGTYTVTETQPVTYGDGQETVGSAGGTNSVNDEIALALTGGTDATGYDFGEIQASSIAGSVVDDAGTGIAGVTITLTGTDDLGSSVTATTTTASGGPGTAGTYGFNGLRPGTYTITETQPAAYGDGSETAGTAGGDDSVDDVISTINLASDEDATGYDFDETRGSIAGTVYEDTNNNGTQDSGEPAISGVTVELDGTDANGDAVALSTTTATNGSYSFDDLLAGTYDVSETQPTGYLDGIDTAGTSAGSLGADEVTAIALTGGTNATGYTFGELLASSIAGTVADDGGTGIAGVTITLTGTDDLGATINTTTTTLADGTYNFDDLRPGTYTVTETQPTGYLDGGEDAGTSGGTVADDVISTITLPTDTNATGYDFDELVASSIAGSVVDDGGNGIAGVTITLTGTDDLGATINTTTTTLADGTYSFTGLRPGTYTITETQPAAYGDGSETAGTSGGDDTTNDVISAITLPVRTDATGYDFDETRGSIAGAVYEDLDGNGTQNGTEPGIAGVTVDLTGTDANGDAVSLTATTAGNGSYVFNGLVAGTYAVDETQPAAYADGQEAIGSAGGTNSVNDEIAAIALTGGVDATGYDFGEVQAASIAGSVVDDGGNPIESVTITLTGTDDLGATINTTTTTLADGSYSFTSLRPGTYTITETQPAAYGDGGEDAGTAGGTVADDVISTVSLSSGEDATGYDFDETRGSIAGVVFEDTNNNGTQDAGELGIAGTSVRLTGVDANADVIDLTVTTIADGSYVFTDLVAGTYRMTETQPAGFADGIDTVGSAGGTLTNDVISTIALIGGDDATGYTFGEIQLSNIAGTVVDDAGTGIAGVTITLTGTDDLGATVNATTTTAVGAPGTAGTYAFDDLRPGTYTVTETQPAGYLDGGETAGTSGGDDSADDVISTITLASNTDATGYNFDETRASSIAGTVVDDAGTGIAGVTITLTGTDDLGATVSTTTTTAANGTYSFNGLRPGTYTVTETQPAGYGDGGEDAGTAGGTIADDTISAITIEGNTTATGYDFDETRGSIAGVVFEDTNNNGVQNGTESGIAGVTVALAGTDVLGNTVSLSATTAGNGSFSFGDLIAGTYTVTETQPTGYLDGIDTAGTSGGTAGADVVGAIALAGGDDATGYTFGEVLASSISGTVVNDGGNGITGVTVALTGTDDLGATVTATTTTAAGAPGTAGTYTFDDLRPGTYTITETQPAGYLDGGETAGTAGGTVADDVVSAITLPSETDATGYDFDELRGSSISGTVVDDADDGIAGVTITLTGTDDLGATVTATTTTAAGAPGTAGTYAFDDLRPGTYTITETQPVGYGDGGEDAGTIAGVTVGVVSDDEITAVTLPANAAATGYDFDEARGSIAGTVYEDLDGNGVQNGAEPGIAGVTVALTGTDDRGNVINLTATTAGTGDYIFGDLFSGTYLVDETQPAGYLDGQETIGSAGGTATSNDEMSITLPAGFDSGSYDFGEVRAASIAGTVFIDADNSGSQNGTEAGVLGATATLTGTDDLGNTVNVSTTTIADGTYSFPGLRPGTYTVTETQPTGLSDGLDRVGTAGGTLGNDVLSSITLGSGTNATGYDFGELEGASISGTVVDDAGDGIPGTTVTLSGTDDLGDLVATSTTTGTDGSYSFNGLRPGTYTVTETQPAGYGDGGEVAGTAGGTVTDDQVAGLVLGSGQNATGYDFDETRATLAGSVYLDTNGNGIRDLGETGISGVSIELTGTDDLGAAVALTTLTTTDGTFAFNDLIAGTYAVTESTQPAGLVDGLEAAGTSGGVAGNTLATNDTITGVVLAGGVDATDYVFGEWDTSTIGGTVVDELGNPIPGVTLTLTGVEDNGGTVNATAVTGPTGVYTFTGLEPGTYTVTETQPAAYGDGGEDVGTVGGTASGTATDDQISGIILGPNESGIDYDFDETLGSISGTVFEDTNGNGTLNSEPGIAGVTLTLTGTDANGGAVTMTTTTATDGSYTFDDVVGGVYAIAQTQPAGYLDGEETIGSAGGTNGTNDVIAGITTTGGADETGYNFGEIDAASISGSVVDDGGNPIPGTTITLTGTDDLGATVNLTDVTDVTGVYSFDGLRPGTYTVTETQPLGYGDGGETAGPVGGTVTNDQIAGIVLGPDTDATGNDFDEERGAVSGGVFEDLDSSGSADIGEPGINGVTITLTGTDVLGATVNETTTTSGNGAFSFDDLIAGDYTITETQPVAFADGDETVGSAGGNAVLQNDTVSSITMGPGAIESGYLFGEVAPVSVSGTVFNDSNNDGSSAGETGIGSVTLNLTGLDDRGQLVNVSTTTATDGTYSFTNLRPGVYTVSEVQPAGFLDGTDTVGTVGGATTGALGPDQITGIGMTSGQTGVGYDFGELDPSSLSGSVVDDQALPIAGVTIALTGTDDLGATVSMSTTTATNGSYSFEDLRPGSYTITETQPVAYGDGGEDAGVIGGTVIGIEADDEISAIVLGAGADGSGYDFDETTASITGQVFVDNDGDTVPSAGDAGLDGVAIQLSGTDVNGQTVNTSTTTAADGTYTFDGLLAGDYTITETQPTGFLDGTDTAGTIAGAVVGAVDNTAGGDAISGVALTAGSDSIGNDFSEVEAGSISGSVVDDGGNGIAGVTLTLTGTDLFGQSVNVTTTTALNGSYIFTGLAPGTYTITETQPIAYGDGGETVGTIDGTSTGTSTDDEIAAITLLSGQDGVGYDFDETRMSISGTVVIDDDNDGVADVGEAPIAGVTLSLTGTDVLGGTVTATTTTATDGTYAFDGLLAGDYAITETQPAGFLDGAETVGSAGGSLGPDSISGITLLAGVDADAYDFGELEPASVAGSIEDDLGRPIEGATVTLTGTDDLGASVTTTTTTDVDGDYIFEDLRPGTYTITETQPIAYGDGGETAGTLGGTVVDDQISDIVVSSGDTGTGYDFDETTGSLAGSVAHATGAGDAPIAGVAIDLTGTDANGDAVVLSATTAADGTYFFDGLLAGDYTITESQPVIFADGAESIGTLGGDATVNDVIASIPVTPGADGTGYDFTEVGTVLSGQVQIDLTGDGVPDPADDVDLSGIVIELIGTDGSVVATTATAADGTYAIGGLVAGDYVVRQTQPTEWGSISSNELPVTLPTTGLANVDFVENASSISGTVFNDNDADGTDDQGTPEAGVTVTLSDSTGVIATTTTDTNGDYTFTGLSAADYTVTIEAPTDSTFTGRDVGSDDGIDSDVDPTNGTVTVMVPAGTDVVDLDAGIVELNQDLAIVITTEDTSVNVGDEVTFTTTVTNSGNTTITGGVTVTIPVPPQTEFVSASGQGWTITIEDGVITATRPDPLAPGEVAPPISFTVETTQVGSIDVTGQVVSSSGLVETTTSNNVSSVPVTVTSTPITSIPNLAYTGGSVLLLLLIAGGLIFSGQALTLIGGRRNEDDQQ